MRLRAERRVTGREMNALLVEGEGGPVEVTLAAVGSFDASPYERRVVRYSYAAALYEVDGEAALVVRSVERDRERSVERVEVYLSTDGGRTWTAGPSDVDRFATLEPVDSLEG